MKNGFAIYLRQFGNYDAVYGSLGTVVAFLFFVYISANIMLLGAEMAAEWPRVIHGYYDDVPEDGAQKRESAEPREPLWRRLRAGLTGCSAVTREPPTTSRTRAAGTRVGGARPTKSPEEPAGGNGAERRRGRFAVRKGHVVLFPARRTGDASRGFVV